MQIQKSVICFQKFQNTPTSLAVSVRIMSFRHLLIQRSMIEQLLHRRHNHVRICSHEFYRARLNCFRPLCGITHNQDRLAQTGRLLLHTTTISQYQISLLHQKNERFITQRLDQMHIAGITQQTFHRLLNVGVEMNGINVVRLGVRLCKSTQSLADVLETLTKVLPSVPSHKNVLLSQHSRVQARRSQSSLHLHLQFSRLVNLLDYPLQGINNRIARNGDGGRIDMLVKQGILIPLRRSEMHSRQAPRQHTVSLLGPRRRQVTRTQSSFYMAHRDLLVKSSKGGSECGRSVTMNQYDIRLKLPQYIPKPQQYPRRNIVKILPFFHQV